jgi:hypothetical protein
MLNKDIIDQLIDYIPYHLFHVYAQLDLFYDNTKFRSTLSRFSYSWDAVIRDAIEKNEVAFCTQAFTEIEQAPKEIPIDLTYHYWSKLSNRNDTYDRFDKYWIIAVEYGRIAILDVLQAADPRCKEMQDHPITKLSDDYKRININKQTNDWIITNCILTIDTKYHLYHTFSMAVWQVNIRMLEWIYTAWILSPGKSVLSNLLFVLGGKDIETFYRDVAWQPKVLAWARSKAWRHLSDMSDEALDDAFVIRTALLNLVVRHPVEEVD